ncbi:hypothetical protein TorRG33x02_265530 [Trema orientale]|uniref:Uncharacterized protein n=1 Tax=Trema orientale TaxID=63057 RepID=A0A2P5D1S4_TREOI|nr:hypothetical protein TorRG33x02_265530 [Trema orientale]
MITETTKTKKINENDSRFQVLRRRTCRNDSLIATELEAILVHSFHHIMAEQVTRLHQILPAQELIPANPLQALPEIVDEHVGLRVTALLAPGQHPGREYGLDPTRRVGPIPPRPIDQNHVPIHVVHVVGQVVQPEPAI